MISREEAIAYFKRHIELYCVEGISRESEEMAVKALEERKETVTEFADRCRECGREKVLDKIRAEIWDLQYGNEEKSMTDEDRADAYNNAIRQVIDIIDKYKAESEDKE